MFSPSDPTVRELSSDQARKLRQSNLLGSVSTLMLVVGLAMGLAAGAWHLQTVPEGSEQGGESSGDDATSQQDSPPTEGTPADAPPNGRPPC